VQKSKSVLLLQNLLRKYHKVKSDNLLTNTHNQRNANLTNSFTDRVNYFNYLEVEFPMKLSIM
jgi:hypothetical protein